MSADERTTIGPYRVVARVGAGGMGVVFKGWDPRLERDVAIKVLHPDRAADPERQRRLLAEGRAASALNHPNILRVYDADVDGSSYYLVSEWLEGNSLRDELSKGPLPLKRLLDLAVQLADGLAAAHAVGIVHRDIKPENVMLARDGSARIVDFGLARSDPHAPTMAAAVAQASTVTLEGGLSGTPAYMSPEQARGAASDFRTDQFAFGALLYEMATGRRAFFRDTTADTLAAVLHDEPRPIADANPRIPAPVRWVIERCLAKGVADRYSATDDLARELRWIRDHLSEALAEPKGAGPPARGFRGRSGFAVAGLAVGMLAVIGLTRSAPETPAATFTPFASASEYEGDPMWSPDGQTLAYSADVAGVLQVFIKRVGDATSRQLTQGRFDSDHPFWDHDGRRVFFTSFAGEHESLWAVGIAGGRPDLILANVRRAAMDPDGTRLALLRDEPDTVMRLSLWWSSPPGAEPQRETRAPFDRLRTGGEDGQLRFSQDGQLLVWVYDVDQINTAESGRASRYYVLPRSGEPREVLTNLAPSTNLTPFDWLPDNRQIVVALSDRSGGNRHLWIADTVSGARRQLTSGHTTETSPAVSLNSGRIAYATEEVDFDLALITPDGRARRTLLATARNEFDPAWSPAGDQFAFVTDRSGSIEIWGRSRDGQWERPIVTAADFGSSRTDTLASLAFSPDGRTLAYQRGAEGTFEVWVSPVTGGTPVRVSGADIAATDIRPWYDAPTWSPDGEWLVLMKNVAGKMTLIKSRVGTSEVVDLLPRPLIYSRAAWSPDGRWVATQTDEGLVLVPIDGGKPEAVTDIPIMAFTWRPDSRRLVALTESDTPGHFAIVEVNAMTGAGQMLNPDLGSIPIAIQPIRGFSYLEGQGFLTSLASARSDIWLLDPPQAPGNWLLRWLRGAQ